MQVKLKRVHPDAILPTQADGNVGFDVYAVEDVMLPPGLVAMAAVGWQLAAEPVASGSCIHGNLRMMLKFEGRSGLAFKGIFPVGGVVDPSYRGELKVLLYNSSREAYLINKGDRMAQLVMTPVVAFSEVEDVEKSDRGEGGFGSTGR